MDSILYEDEKGKKQFRKEFLDKLKNDYYNEEVKVTIQTMVPKKLVDCDDMTLLHHAVYARNVDLVKYLIARGFEVDARNKDLDTPLALASRRCYPEMMKVLLQSGADVFARNCYKMNIFEIGLAEHTMDRLDAAELLLEELDRKYPNDVYKMADILLSLEKPFPRAMLLKNSAVTKRMLIKGCSPNDRDCFQETALHYAVACMHFENVALLVRFGADVNAMNWKSDTPIHRYHFGKDNHYKILDLLMQYGASLTKTNEQRDSLMSRTFEKEEAKHIKELLDRGVDLRELSYGRSPLHFLACNTNPGVVEVLGACAFEVDVRDNLGRSPLFIAAEHDNLDVVDFLLKKVADPNIADGQGKTVLYYSLFWRKNKELSREDTSRYLRCVGLLLEYEADVQFVGSRPVADARLNENYLRKVKEMKNTRISEAVTLLMFMVASEKKCLHYARNSDIRAELQSIFTQERNSPFYLVKLLCSLIGSIVESAVLREEAALGICKLSGRNVRSVFDNVIDYLDKESMINVCQAAKNIPDDKL